MPAARPARPLLRRADRRALRGRRRRDRRGRRAGLAARPLRPRPQFPRPGRGHARLRRGRGGDRQPAGPPARRSTSSAASPRGSAPPATSTSAGGCASAGWTLEQRPAARVAHHHREDLVSFLAMIARYGAGSRWLNERHPGAAPHWPLVPRARGQRPRRRRSPAPRPGRAGRLPGARRPRPGRPQRRLPGEQRLGPIWRCARSTRAAAAAFPRRARGGVAVARARSDAFSTIRRRWTRSKSAGSCSCGFGASASPASRSRSRAATAGPSGCRPGGSASGLVGRIYGVVMGHRPLTGYHVFAFTIPLLILHLPYVMGVDWTLAAGAAHDRDLLRARRLLGLPVVRLQPRLHRGPVQARQRLVVRGPLDLALPARLLHRDRALDRLRRARRPRRRPQPSRSCTSSGCSPGSRC